MARRKKKVEKEEVVKEEIVEEVEVKEEPEVVEEPKEEEIEIAEGDTVRITGFGYSNTYGTMGYKAGGIGWVRTVQKIHKDGEGNLTEFPYQIGMGNMTTGFYKADALEKK